MGNCCAARRLKLSSWQHAAGWMRLLRIFWSSWRYSASMRDTLKAAGTGERFEKLEERRIPEDIDYQGCRGCLMKPCKSSGYQAGSIGQASRISGVNPADINVLLINLEKARRKS